MHFRVIGRIGFTATLDELTVDVTFSLVTLSAAATDSGIAMS